MGYRDDEEALAAEALELKRRLAAVQAELVLLPSALERFQESNEGPDEPWRDDLRREVERLRRQLRAAEAELASQRERRAALRVARREGRRDLRLNDPFHWGNPQPAPESAAARSPSARGIGCAVAFVLVGVAVLVGLYLLMAAFRFIG
jgi:hypothetical protein